MMTLILKACEDSRIRNYIGCCTRHVRMHLCAPKGQFRLNRFKINGYSRGLILACDAMVDLIRGMFSPSLCFSRCLSRKMVKRNYYVILGIAPKVTQAQVMRFSPKRCIRGYSGGLVLGCNATLDLERDVFSPSLCFWRSVSSETAKRSYYDVLGITPKATQAQVKKAYYELSKTYHPDQYKGIEDAALKFREISEAYEVLGNFQKRRMYDKGVLTYNRAATPQEAEEYSSKFYESRSKRSKMPSSGRTPIYNFDEWSQSHYASAFGRRQKSKNIYEELKKRKKEDAEVQKVENVMYVGLFIVLALVFRAMLSSDEDKPTPQKTPSNT